MKTHIVYMVRLRVDGRRYVGVTGDSISARRASALTRAKNGASDPLAEAIAQYGKSAFEWSILAESQDRNEALRLERELTVILRPEFNQIFGGGGRSFYIHKERAAGKPPQLHFMATPKNEEWNPVQGYEGLYEVSSHGRVRSLDRFEECGRMVRHRKGRFLRFSLDKRDDCLVVHLSKNAKQTPHRLGTIVTEAFLGHRPAQLRIGYIDGDKANNKIGNLFYGTEAQIKGDAARARANGAVEEWRSVVGHEGYYEVSSFGKIRSIRSGKLLKPRIDANSNRLSVCLAVDCVHRYARISTLVAEAFLGPRPDDKEVCHWSDDKTDNGLSNIYYGTHIENCLDRSRNGKSLTRTKLSESDVEAIKSALANPGKIFQRELACQYGVAAATISAIATGKIWQRVRGK